MRTFAPKPKTTQQTKATAKSMKPGSGPHRDVHSVLRLQRTIGNQAVQRLMAAPCVQRRVAVDVTRQSITPQAVSGMTDSEIEEQGELCRQTASAAEPQSAELSVAQCNLGVLEAEQRSRAGERQGLLTGPPQALIDACQGQVTLYSGVLENVKDATGNAARRGLRMFERKSEVSEPQGIQFADLFGVVLEALPFAGPIARFIKNDLVRQAAVEMLRETTARASTIVEGQIRGGSAATAEAARENFAATRASDFDEMERIMGQAKAQAVATYNAAIQAGRSNPSGLLNVYRELQNLIIENQGLGREDFDVIADRFEMRLYREYYSPRVRIDIYQSDTWGVHSRTIVGMPGDVQLRIRQLTGDSCLAEVMRWGVPVVTTETSGRPY
jgi:hypothetical protein